MCYDFGSCEADAGVGTCAAVSVDAGSFVYSGTCFLPVIRMIVEAMVMDQNLERKNLPPFR